MVEIAIVSTTTNLASVPPWKLATATTMKIVAKMPDIVLTRTGVPKVRLKTPKNPGKAPS